MVTLRKVGCFFRLRTAVLEKNELMSCSKLTCILLSAVYSSKMVKLEYKFCFFDFPLFSKKHRKKKVRRKSSSESEEESGGTKIIRI